MKFLGSMFQPEIAIDNAHKGDITDRTRARVRVLAAELNDWVGNKRYNPVAMANNAYGDPIYMNNATTFMVTKVANGWMLQVPGDAGELMQTYVVTEAEGSAELSRIFLMILTERQMGVGNGAR